MGTHPIFESDFDCLTACGDVDKEMSDSDNAASHPHWKRIFDKRLKFLIWSLIVALFISIGCNVLLYFMFYSCNLSTSAKDLKDNTAQVQPTVTHASTNRTFDAQVEHIKARQNQCTPYLAIAFVGSRLDLTQMERPVYSPRHFYCQPRT